MRSQGCRTRPSACGQPVDKSTSSDPTAVDFSVDRMARIVRNPIEPVREEANVDDLWKIDRTCSLGYFLRPVKVGRGIHNPPVLTGTIIDLSFSKR